MLQRLLSRTDREVADAAHPTVYREALVKEGTTLRTRQCEVVVSHDAATDV